MITELTSTSEKHSMMKYAKLISKSSTCLSRQVGSLIITKDKLMLPSYNDKPLGLGECKNDTTCRCHLSDKESGKDLDKIKAIHAEARGIAYAARRGVAIDGATIIVTDQPCNDCAKLIIESGIKRVIYDRVYPNSDSIAMFMEAGIAVERYSLGGDIDESTDSKDSIIESVESI